MKFGVIIFPGSNCDHDAYWTIQNVAHQPVTFLWHDSEDLQNCDAIIVPGGFAYGDYLRTGAIAKFSPVMQSVRKFADGGGLVLGLNAMLVVIMTVSSPANGPTRSSRTRPTRSCGWCSAASAGRTCGTTGASRRTRPARSATSSSASSSRPVLTCTGSAPGTWSWPRSSTAT